MHKTILDRSAGGAVQIVAESVRPARRAISARTPVLVFVIDSFEPPV
jgi:hypothetical protein